MTLARKDLLSRIMPKPEDAMIRQSKTWKAGDMNSLAVLAKRLGPVYETMIREASIAFEAWELLRTFVMKQNLHNRVQLRKQLHELEIAQGDNLMSHLMKFDDLCLRLAAVGDPLGENEKLVDLLGSLSSELEILRREFETLTKRGQNESAFKAATRNSNGGHRNFRDGSQLSSGNNKSKRGSRDQRQVQCSICKRWEHRGGQCRRCDNAQDTSAFVFSASGEREQYRQHDSGSWLFDSGASSHPTYSRNDISEYQQLQGN
ncbi:TPA: hypothetical protein N0F65_000467 [Lagenidium giganteum]|uniref:Polyprotein n=1 Tax=Lagenidium giganteum TaxID=4803 RepID=A0AAV2Z271_9STRA|nr:TPA: hypothetical protein N0F65_000467 [Lagenidium giganteum]